MLLIALGACAPPLPAQEPEPPPVLPVPRQRYYDVLVTAREVARIDDEGGWTKAVCVEAIEKASHTEPVHRGFNVYLEAVVYDRCGHVDEARKAMRETLRAGRRDSLEALNARLWLILDELEHKGDAHRRAAAKQLDELIKDASFRHADALIALSRVQQQLAGAAPENAALREEAHKNLLRAIAVDGVHETARFELVQFHLRAAGVPARGAISAPPSSSPRDAGSERALKLAHVVAVEAVEAFADNPRLHFALGEVYRARGLFGPALAAFTKASELRPAMLEAHLARGAVLLRLRASAPAERAFRAAVALDENGYEALIGLSVALRSQREPARVEEAQATIAKALEIAPERAPAHYEAALVALARSSIASAKQHLAHFIARSEGDPALRAARIRAQAKLEELGT